MPASRAKQISTQLLSQIPLASKHVVVSKFQMNIIDLHFERHTTKVR